MQTSSSDIAGHSIATPASAEVHRQIGAKCAELLQPFRPQPLLKWPAQSPPLWTEQPGGTPPQDPSHLHRCSPAAFGCAVERTQLRACVRIRARVRASPPAAGSALHAPWRSYAKCHENNVDGLVAFRVGWAPRTLACIRYVRSVRAEDPRQRCTRCKDAVRDAFVPSITERAKKNGGDGRGNPTSSPKARTAATCLGAIGPHAPVTHRAVHARNG